MTRLLASVTSINEAAIALAGGADIIDLKNPHDGALGALPLDTIRQIVDFVDGRVAVSATIGDLPMQPSLVADRVKATAATGVDIVKIGLFGSYGHIKCIEELSSKAASGISIIAVLFADERPDFSLLQPLARAGFLGAMLDTSTKLSGRLVDQLDEPEMRDFVQKAKSLDLLTGLAGSLRAEDVIHLASLEPDYLGFRGALCVDGQRTASIDAAKLTNIASLLREYNTRQLLMV